MKSETELLDRLEERLKYAIGELENESKITQGKLESLNSTLTLVRTWRKELPKAKS
jgi:hypothetical protein